MILAPASSNFLRVAFTFFATRVIMILAGSWFWPLTSLWGPTIRTPVSTTQPNHSSFSFQPGLPKTLL